MDIVIRAKGIIEKGEKEFRALISEAAQLGDYETVESLTEWVLILKEIPNIKKQNSIAMGSRSNSKPTARTKRKSRKRNGKSNGFPKFAKLGDNLVKIAWSKAKKNEYRHKSPRQVLSKLAEILQEKTAQDTIVSMEDVLPITASDGTEIPDYQAYLCLAWLRNIHAIEQKGREGYSRIDTNRSVIEIANSAWSELPIDSKKVKKKF